MAVKFFGQYLVEHKIITRMNLLQAIELQEKNNLRFGEMVIAMGLLSEEQAATIHRAQRNQDLQFGDMAVQLGFLSPDQVQHVLNKQRSQHLFIGQALVKIGALTEEQLDNHLQAFNGEQQSYLSEKITIPAGVPHRPIWEMVADLTYKMLTRIAGLSFRPGPCVPIDKIPSRPVIVEMGFSGVVSARYLLTVSENTRTMIANAILQEQTTRNQSEPLDEPILEFVKIVCGNVVNKAVQLGYAIDITPARIHTPDRDDLNIPEDQTAIQFPIYLSDGEIFELTISVQKERTCP
ncbi:hypothetical protein [Pelobacter seleniigenes]|uniref:hypothetical protein n=1 Tax=Pelobacter seleniigenes TaxID=407188 RepID=UPI0004A6C763|nr:hypothetical protein [Pelobacter seleniigenes]